MMLLVRYKDTPVGQSALLSACVGSTELAGRVSGRRRSGRAACGRTKAHLSPPLFRTARPLRRTRLHPWGLQQPSFPLRPQLASLDPDHSNLRVHTGVHRCGTSASVFPPSPIDTFSPCLANTKTRLHNRVAPVGQSPNISPSSPSPLSPPLPPLPRPSNAPSASPPPPTPHFSPASSHPCPAFSLPLPCHSRRSSPPAQQTYPAGHP